MLRRAFWSAAAARVLAVFGIAGVAKAASEPKPMTFASVVNPHGRKYTYEPPHVDPTLCGIWEQHSDIQDNFRTVTWHVTSEQSPPPIPDKVFDYCPGGFIKVRFDFASESIVLGLDKVAYTLRGTIEYMRIVKRKEVTDGAGSS